MISLPAKPVPPNTSTLPRSLDSAALCTPAARLCVRSRLLRAPRRPGGDWLHGLDSAHAGLRSDTRCTACGLPHGQGRGTQEGRPGGCLHALVRCECRILSLSMSRKWVVSTGSCLTPRRDARSSAICAWLELDERKSAVAAASCTGLRAVCGLTFAQAHMCAGIKCALCQLQLLCHAEPRPPSAYNQDGCAPGAMPACSGSAIVGPCSASADAGRRQNQSTVQSAAPLVLPGGVAHLFALLALQRIRLHPALLAKRNAAVWSQC